MIRTMLLAAALAAAAAPALADDIGQGQECRKKVASGSWHLCGAAPAAGQITYTNTGTHEVIVFTYGGTQSFPYVVRPVAGTPIVERKDVTNVDQWQKLKPGESGGLPVAESQPVLIGRVDHMLSDRTIAVRFDDVP
jgi:hypothetical protein